MSLNVKCKMNIGKDATSEKKKHFISYLSYLMFMKGYDHNKIFYPYCKQSTAPYNYY